MPKKKTLKKKALKAPADRDEASKLLASIGRLQRRVEDLETRMNNRLAAIKEDYSEQAKPLLEELEAQFSALHTWAEAHRQELLDGKGKSLRLASGVLSWRTTPPKVTVTKVDAVLERLRALRLEEFIRTKEEVDKHRVLEDPETVKGVKGISISQREEFVCKPFESQIERAKPVKKNKAS